MAPHGEPLAGWFEPEATGILTVDPDAGQVTAEDDEPVQRRHPGQPAPARIDTASSAVVIAGMAGIGLTSWAISAHGRVRSTEVVRGSRAR